MPEQELTPLKIVFKMRSEICLGHPWIHFDGILAHLLQRKYNPDYWVLPSNRVEDVDLSKMPLKKTGEIYHASVSFFDVGKMYSTLLHKRFCEEYLDLNRVRVKKIDRGRGYFKDYRMRFITIPARTVTFYACGIKEEIQELLEALPGLGKKVSVGFGEIQSFSIEEIDEDISVVKDGVAMRPIPKDMLQYWGDLAVLAYKPPYWDRTCVKECVPPNQTAILRKEYAREMEKVF